MSVNLLVSLLELSQEAFLARLRAARPHPGRSRLKKLPLKEDNLFRSVVNRERCVCL